MNLWLPADVGVYNLHLHILCMYIEEKYPNQQQVWQENTMLLEIVLIFGVFLSATQTSEICKSDSGKMTISEETNILAIFKG